MDIIEIEGIGTKYKEKLKAAGIDTVEELLYRGKTPEGRKEIAKTAGISSDLILKWVNLADLFRVNGIGEEYSDLLGEAGVDSVEELSCRNPDDLFKKIAEINRKKKLVRRLPTLSDVKEWVEQANILPALRSISDSSIKTEPFIKKRPLSVTFIVISAILFLATSLITVFSLGNTDPLSAIAVPFFIFGLLSLITSAALFGVNFNKDKNRTRGFKLSITYSGIVTFIAFVLLIVSIAVSPVSSPDKLIVEEETITETKAAINEESAQIKEDVPSENTVKEVEETTEVATTQEEKPPSELEETLDTTTSTTEETAQATPAGPLKIHFIDVGQGDSALIQTPEGNVILIDGGPTSFGPSLVSYLKNNGVSKINVVVATHPHEDHIGSLINVLNSFNVDNIIDSGVSHTTKTYENYLNAIQSKDINFVNWSVGQSFDVGNNVSMQIVGPTSKSSDLNNSSIVILLSYNNSKFLFTGDAESKEEVRIVSSGAALKADVLKVSHHGSSSSCCIQFLNAVNPKVTIISCGVNNGYGHPHEITLENLTNIGATIYRTDLTGTIIIESDGYNINIRKGEPYTYVKAVNEETAQDEETTITETVEEQPSQTGAFVGSIKSDVFHKPDCRYVKQILPENIIWFSSREDAIAHGYRPCKVCNP